MFHFIYFQLEFEEHEVVYAEGLTVESLRLDAGQRERFSNFVEYERLYGHDPAPLKPCAPMFQYRGARDDVVALLRLAASSVGVDLRDPVQVAYDSVVHRGRRLTPAESAVEASTS